MPRQPSFLTPICNGPLRDGLHSVSNLRRWSRVAIGAKYLVRGIPVEVWSDEWADIFPDDVALRRNLKDATPLALADQCVSACESLCSADVRAEKRVARPAAIFPHRLPCLRIELDHAGEWIGGNVAAVG